ncbi:MAG: type II toxin-antitoxin system VapC family toxin [Deltaproteobacteria bacterium]|nr:type II toxin-antitoxin system VapC family toxin [Deltaproteobacteria bacterium]
MILLDANLLLYAYNPSAEPHEKARLWLEAAFSDGETVGLPWATILAFLRIGTNPRAFPHPLTLTEGIEIVAEWLDLPPVRIVEPTERHWEVLASLLASAKAKGPLVSDAHLAALAIEHGALLCSSDADFARFAGLRLHDPLRAERPSRRPS